MRLSSSEAKVLCRRVFCGLGLPAGSDSDLAENLVWLELQGISYLKVLVSDADQLLNQPFNSIQIHETSDSMYQIDLGSDIGYLTILETVDFLTAKASQLNSSCCVANLRNIRNPLLFLPVTFRHSLEGVGFKFQLKSCQILVQSGELWTSDPLEEFARLVNVANLTIHCYLQQKNMSAENYSNLIPRDVEKIHQKNIEHGIRIDDGDFWALKKLATRSFVPATEQSRMQGAGAEVDDSI